MFKDFFNKLLKRNRQPIAIRTINLVADDPLFQNGYNVEDLKRYEKEVLARTDSYDFFGYLFDKNHEMPKFFVQSTQPEEGATVKFMHCPTPKILTHCVKHLTDEAKKHEASNLSYFKEKCSSIAEYAVYQDDDWFGTINHLVTYMAQFIEHEDADENC